MSALVECVPNFSEGRDKATIQKITDEIQKIEGVKLLDVDPGEGTNRTVVTFIGEPEPVKEAAFRAIQKAAELIDMRKHKGAHARMGATDVCPFIPIAGITMEDCVRLAHELGERVGKELAIPVYFYEHAAAKPERANLADIRAGEYEGMPEKMQKPEWQPDCGPAEFNAKSGATVIGARDFLIAYNVNLNTKDVSLAQQIAFAVREKGRVKKDANGKAALDEKGEKVYEPGKLKAVKAVGWYIEEFGFCQISINLVNYKITPPHVAFDAVCEEAAKYGLRVTGSELVGLLPGEALFDAGRHYLRKQNRSEAVSEEELIKMAVLSLGLDQLNEFDPQQKVIEYTFKQDGPLVKMTARQFLNELASESSAPGGGSVAAFAGAMGAGLVSMVGNLTVNSKKYKHLLGELAPVAVEAQRLKDMLREAIDADTAAFNRILAANRLPKATDAEKATRQTAIQTATKYAAEVPLETVRRSRRILDLAKVMLEKGNPNSLSDAAVAAMMAYAAVKGAEWNVRINLQSLEDTAYKSRMLNELTDLVTEARLLFEEVDQKMHLAL